MCTLTPELSETKTTQSRPPLHKGTPSAASRSTRPEKNVSSSVPPHEFPNLSSKEKDAQYTKLLNECDTLETKLKKLSTITALIREIERLREDNNRLWDAHKAAFGR